MVKPKMFIGIIFSMLLSSTFCFSQTVRVYKETKSINSENAIGFAIDVDGVLIDVKASLIKYLKTFGKTKNQEFIILSEATLNGKLYALPIYSTTKETNAKTQVWFGIKTGEWPKDDLDNINNQLEKLASEFGIKFYRDKIQLQIDESIRALQAVEKQQQKLINQNRDLNTKLEGNKRSKIQLEKALVDNKVEFETLLNKIEQNKKDQDSVQIANEQIKKVIIIQQEKQNKVN